ncbi:unnamed protein product [Amoebophrya sp. A25]|nr:unnamed protein product [Amoebophrya sp. A25]|eukprot:GSA25T00013457001.1
MRSGPRKIKRIVSLVLWPQQISPPILAIGIVFYFGILANLLLRSTSVETARNELIQNAGTTDEHQAEQSWWASLTFFVSETFVGAVAKGPQDFVWYFETRQWTQSMQPHYIAVTAAAYFLLYWYATFGATLAATILVMLAILTKVIILLAFRLVFFLESTTSSTRGATVSRNRRVDEQPDLALSTSLRSSASSSLFPPRSLSISQKLHRTGSLAIACLKHSLCLRFLTPAGAWAECSGEQQEEQQLTTRDHGKSPTTRRQEDSTTALNIELIPVPVRKWLFIATFLVCRAFVQTLLFVLCPLYLLLLVLGTFTAVRSAYGFWSRWLLAGDTATADTASSDMATLLSYSGVSAAYGVEEMPAALFVPFGTLSGFHSALVPLSRCAVLTLFHAILPLSLFARARLLWRRLREVDDRVADVVDACPLVVQEGQGGQRAGIIKDADKFAGEHEQECEKIGDVILDHLVDVSDVINFNDNINALGYAERPAPREKNYDPEENHFGHVDHNRRTNEKTMKNDKDTRRFAGVEGLQGTLNSSNSNYNGLSTSSSRPAPLEFVDFCAGMMCRLVVHVSSMWNDHDRFETVQRELLLPHLPFPSLFLAWISEVVMRAVRFLQQAWSSRPGNLRAGEDQALSQTSTRELQSVVAVSLQGAEENSHDNSMRSGFHSPTPSYHRDEDDDELSRQTPAGGAGRGDAQKHRTPGTPDSFGDDDDYLTTKGLVASSSKGDASSSSTRIRLSRGGGEYLPDGPETRHDQARGESDTVSHNKNYNAHVLQVLTCSSALLGRESSATVRSAPYDCGGESSTEAACRQRLETFCGGGPRRKAAASFIVAAVKSLVCRPLCLFAFLARKSVCRSRRVLRFTLLGYFSIAVLLTLIGRAAVYPLAFDRFYFVPSHIAMLLVRDPTPLGAAARRYLDLVPNGQNDVTDFELARKSFPFGCSHVVSAASRLQRNQDERDALSPGASILCEFYKKQDASLHVQTSPDATTARQQQEGPTPANTRKTAYFLFHGNAAGIEMSFNEASQVSARFFPDEQVDAYLHTYSGYRSNVRDTEHVTDATRLQLRAAILLREGILKHDANARIVVHGISVGCCVLAGALNLLDGTYHCMPQLACTDVELLHSYSIDTRSKGNVELIHVHAASTCLFHADTLLKRITHVVFEAPFDSARTIFLRKTFFLLSPWLWFFPGQEESTVDNLAAAVSRRAFQAKVIVIEKEYDEIVYADMSAHIASRVDAIRTERLATMGDPLRKKYHCPDLHGRGKTLDREAMHDAGNQHRRKLLQLADDQLQHEVENHYQVDSASPSAATRILVERMNPRSDQRGTILETEESDSAGNAAPLSCSFPPALLVQRYASHNSLIVNKAQDSEEFRIYRTFLRDEELSS